MAPQLDDSPIDCERGHFREQFRYNGIDSVRAMDSECANEPARSRFRAKHRISKNLDMLTGLPNRPQFFEELQLSIANAAATKRSVAVGVVDLDGFKPVNDTHGHRISLDDFGTGYSSLSYIHALPIKNLKIDKSFISDIKANPRSRNIVRSLITLCHDLGVACIIEGVETTDQLHIVRELGGAAIQGYYFSMPMPAANVHAYLRNNPAV